MAEVFINGRFLQQATTGVQRYGKGLLPWFDRKRFQVLEPDSAGRIAGLRWEHFTLPGALKHHNSPLLLNFGNTAPYSYRHQIITLHDVAPLEHPEWYRRSFAEYYKRLIPRISQRSAHIVTVSEDSKSRIMAVCGVPSDKVTVIPPPVSAALLTSVPKPVPGLSSGFILMVGSLDPRKQFTLTAEHILPWIERNGMQLVWAGRRGAPFPDLRFPKSKAMIEVDAPDDGALKWLYQNAALVVQPSLYEGFSLVPSEALSFRTQVLVSDISVHREVLGQRATYFDPNVLHSLPEQLEHALRHPIEFHIHEAPYSYKDAADQWLSLVTKMR